jgi:two-component system sensor histidine kinase TorS
MDISLPGASGFEVTQAIHELDGGRWRQLPVIGMSAHVTAGTLDRQAAAGMAGFLGKPFQRGELSRALATAVGAVAALPVLPVLPACQAPDEAALLDLDYLAEEVEGLGRPLLLQLLDMFRQQAGLAGTSLQEALDRADFVRIAGLAHKLRSAAGNLGLVCVMADCRRIEQQAGQGDQPASGMAMLLGRLQADCTLSIGALELWLAATGPAGAAQERPPSPASR